MLMEFWFLPFFYLIFAYTILKLVMLELLHLTLSDQVCCQGRCGQQNANSANSPYSLMLQFVTMWFSYTARVYSIQDQAIFTRIQAIYYYKVYALFYSAKILQIKEENLGTLNTSAALVFWNGTSATYRGTIFVCTHFCRSKWPTQLY